MFETPKPHKCTPKPNFGIISTPFDIKNMPNLTPLSKLLQNHEIKLKIRRKKRYEKLQFHQGKLWLHQRKLDLSIMLLCKSLGLVTRQVVGGLAAAETSSFWDSFAPPTRNPQCRRTYDLQRIFIEMFGWMLTS